MAIKRTSSAISTSIGRTGMASRFSIVPRSRSRVMANVVRNMVDIMSTIRGREARSDVEHGKLLPGCSARARRIETAQLQQRLQRRRHIEMEGRRMSPKAPVALPIAVGSVPSASTRIDGASPGPRNGRNCRAH